MTSNQPSPLSRHLPKVLLVLFAVLAGAGLPGYIGAVDNSLARAMALPAMLLLGLLLMYSRTALLMLIILGRASGDVFFDATKVSLGPLQIGVGGLINIFVILIALLLVIEKPALLPKKMLGMWVPFLLIGAASIAFSPVKGDAVRLYLALISYFAIFVSAFYLVRCAEDFKRCVRLVLWSALFPAVYGLLNIAIHGAVIGPNGARLQSTFSHPNIYAFYLTLVISMGFYVLKSATYKLSTPARIGLSAYCLLMMALLLLTQTRSAWIACFALFAAYAVLFERRYLLYLIVLPVLGLLVPSVRERVLDLGAGNEVIQYAKLNSFAWRVYLWESGLHYMQATHYLLGYGIDSFQHFSPTFFPLAGKTNFNAHNLYVQWIFELGAAGLLAYLYLMARVLWVLKMLLPINRLGAFVLLAMVIQYLMVSASDNMAYYLAFNWYFWLMIGAGCAVVANAPAKHKHDENNDGRHFNEAR